MQYTVILQTTLHNTRPSVFFDLLLSNKPKLQITYCSLEKKVNQRICFVHIEMVKMGTFSCSKEVSVWISSLLSTDSTETELIYSKFKNTIFFGSITIFYYSTFFPHILIMDLIATLIAAVIPKCCIKTKTDIPIGLLLKVQRWDVQQSSGACDIPALV